MTSRFLFHSSGGLSDCAISAFVIVGFDIRKKIGGDLALALKGLLSEFEIDSHSKHFGKGHAGLELSKNAIPIKDVVSVKPADKIAPTSAHHVVILTY